MIFNGCSSNRGDGAGICGHSIDLILCDNSVSRSKCNSKGGPDPEKGQVHMRCGGDDGVATARCSSLAYLKGRQRANGTIGEIVCFTKWYVYS